MNEPGMNVQKNEWNFVFYYNCSNLYDVKYCLTKWKKKQQTVITLKTHEDSLINE